MSARFSIYTGMNLVLRLLTAIVICFPWVAFAHHDTQTTSLTTAMPQVESFYANDSDALLSLHSSLSHQVSYFGRWKREQQRYEGLPEGSALLNQTTIGFSLRSRVLTRVAATLPFGLLSVMPPAGKRKHRFGLGDMQLDLRQELLSLLDLAGPVSVDIGVGIRLPTGLYRTDIELGSVDVAIDGTEINSTTFNMRANLGSGSWATNYLLSASADVGERASLRANLSYLRTLTSTPDKIRWGSDMVAALRVDIGILARGQSTGMLTQMAAIVAADYYRHGLDSAMQQGELPDTIQRITMGGRQAFAMSFGLRLSTRNKIFCDLAAHVPLWQQVGGIQLVETVSIRTACSLHW